MARNSRSVLWFSVYFMLTKSQISQPSITSVVYSQNYSQSIVGYTHSKFPNEESQAPPYFISSLNFYSDSGMIVVGAADWLYVLNPNLTLVAQLSLPPRASTAACSAAVGYNPDYVCRNHLRVFSSSPNDPTKLLVCGSEAIGTPFCRAVDTTLNFTSFTAVQAESGMVSIRPDFYGYGITYNVNNPRNITFFAVSTLNLDATNTGLFFFSVNYTNTSDPNTLSTMLRLRTNSVANFRAPVFVDTYVANYAPRTAILPGVMDIISPDEHKYFFVFLRDSLSNGTTISQVVRVCQNDPGNSTDNAPLTLVKARINCISANSSTNYNAIAATAFNEMGRYYQNGDWSKFMYGVFTTSIGGIPISAVCVYPANNSVDDTTDANGRNGGVFDIFRTLLMNPKTGAPTTSGYVECTPNGNMARPDYTYTDTILSITQIGSEPLAVIKGVAITKAALDQTCIVTNNASVHTCLIQDVLYLGTAVGTVLKVAIGYSGGNVVPIVSEEIKLTDVSSVRQLDLQQQGGAKYLYVNTDTSIYRIPVQRCNRYSSCSTCVGSRDPYCAWNNSLKKCVVFSIAPADYNGSTFIPDNIFQNIHTGVVNCTDTTVPIPTTTATMTTTVASGLKVSTSVVEGGGGTQLRTLSTALTETPPVGGLGNMATGITPNSVAALAAVFGISIFISLLLVVVMVYTVLYFKTKAQNKVVPQTTSPLAPRPLGESITTQSKDSAKVV